LRTLIEIGGSVFLCGSGTGEMDNHHFKNTIGGIDPFGHNCLEEVFTLEFFFGLGEINSEFFKHIVHGISVILDTGISEFDDGIHNEGNKSSFDSFSIFIKTFIFPFFGGGIKIVITPEFFHHFIEGSLEFGAV